MEGISIKTAAHDCDYTCECFLKKQSNPLIVDDGIVELQLQTSKRIYLRMGAVQN